MPIIVINFLKMIDVNQYKTELLPISMKAPQVLSYL